MNTKINIERIKKDMEAICAFNRTPDKGITRFSYSKEDKAAREYLMQEFHKLDLKVTVDGAGNIRARREGKDKNAPSVMVGSHIDTVLHGGRFDGLLGTLAALEVLRTIHESKGVHDLPIEIVVFAEEEGSNFGSTTTGSKFMVGRNTLEDMHRLLTPDGVSMYTLLKTFGLDPDKIETQQLKSNEVKVMLELHIEQSVVLDTENIPIGIVECIAGVRSFEIVFEGIPNHAGATPMSLRHDAMLAAAHMIQTVEKLAQKSPYPGTVGTVGRILCEPNVANIIPGRVVLSLDIRDVCEEGMDYMEIGIKKEMEAEAKRRGLTFSCKSVGKSRSIHITDDVLEVLSAAAKKQNIPFRRMNSGAVHDCCLIADVAPVGLIFVPSLKGRSHVPEEDTRWEDIEQGVDILYAAVVALSAFSS